MAAERVVIIGAGIGGLAAVLELAKGDRDIVVIERDPPPPDIPAEEAFETWQRPGVPQFRHAHILLARLQTLLRDRHPEVLADLLRAGLELSRMEEVLSAGVRDHAESDPEDRDLLHLWGRRPTFEYVLRKHAGALPNVRFVHSARVTGLVSEPAGHAVRIRGVGVHTDQGEQTFDADIVVDASGKRTKTPEWLAALGVRVDKQSKPSGFVYACRHYRLKNPEASPPRLDGGGNLDFLGYATFYAEHGNFALTFGCPVDEKDLADAIHRPEGFEALCRQLPILEKWTSLSDVKSKVLGAGNFENRWTTFAARGPKVLGFFAVGDSQFETNPMYGRGCSSAFMQAQTLAEVLAGTSDPAARATRYRAISRALLTPYFELSVATDRMYHLRARLKRGEPMRLGERFLNYAYEAAWVPAVQKSLLIAREMVRSAEMREISSVGTRLSVAFELLRQLIRGWFDKPLALPAAGPPRSDVLRSLPAHRGSPAPPPNELHTAP